MKTSILTGLLIAAGICGGCANSTLLVGQQRAAIDSEDVVLYFYERPRCNFETIAWIEMTHGVFGVEQMLADMRQAAAEVGASGLVLIQSQQLSLIETAGSAKAIRCLTG